MKKVINVYEAIVDRCMLDPRYVTKTDWSEVSIPGFGSLITEDCGDKIKASLVKKGIVVFKKYFNKQESVANAA